MSTLFLLLFGLIGNQDTTVCVRSVQPIEVSADYQIERLDSDFVIPPTKYRVVGYNPSNSIFTLEELDSDGNGTGTFIGEFEPPNESWWVGKEVTFPIPPEFS